MTSEASNDLSLASVSDPSISSRRVIRVAAIGFSLLVGFVLLAAYLGYRGSDRIQNSAQSLVREQLVSTGRGLEVEALIIRETQDLMDDLAWVLGLCFLLAAGTAGLTVYIIHNAFLKLEWQSNELAKVSWHLIDGHEKMARRFAHEMHDELGQSLSSLRRLLNRLSPQDLASLRTECVSIVDEVLQSVRKLSQVLRPVVLDDFGLDSGLRWLCERFSQRTNIQIDYQSNFAQRLSSDHETHLFRIAQEALTNIARHSEATSAVIVLDVSPKVVRLSITDNGIGLLQDPKHTTQSLGMVGMRARARQLGGELIVENQVDRGLRLQVAVPFHQGELNADQEDKNFTG